MLVNEEFPTGLRSFLILSPPESSSRFVKISLSQMKRHPVRAAEHTHVGLILIMQSHTRTHARLR